MDGDGDPLGQRDDRDMEAGDDTGIGATCGWNAGCGLTPGTGAGGYVAVYGFGGR